MVAQQDAPTTSHPAVAGRRPRVFSGMQPSGNLHLGNYLGALRNWVRQQDGADNVFCVVDLHALSLPTDPNELRANSLELATTFLAAGIDPARTILFVQSDVREHTEAQWLLASVTQFGELRRMTQFKDKSDGRDDVSAALFTYPVLQAGDILLYDTDSVPVGEDQKQHVEITRDIAHRFNSRYGETFVLPKADIKPEGARIMALDNPLKKMSKSSTTPAGLISLVDEPDAIRKKVRRAVTDSGSEVRGGPDKPALNNLLTIYSLLADRSVADIEASYEGKGYGAFKTDLAEVVVEQLTPIRERLGDLNAHPDEVRRILRDGADRARAIAAPKLDTMRDRMGLGA
ncbi:MAG TPA: tryptophan--tRNA ligase [Thermomicrobiales bacterium]|jgi:tryptophanyl-tRNA synthetase|nr:tryptophan--tRNA ligase [Thermomicrobiales bacterium]